MAKLIALTHTAGSSCRKVQIPARMFVGTMAGYPTLIRTLERDLPSGLNMTLDHRDGEPSLWVGECLSSGYLLI